MVPLQTSKSIKDNTGFCSSVHTITKIFAFNTSDLKNLGQVRAVQNSQLCRLMANINLHKSVARIFTFALTVFEILTFQMFDFENLVQSYRVQLHSNAVRLRITTFLKVIEHVFTQIHPVSEIIQFEMFDLQNLGQGHIVQHLKWFHSMAVITVYKSRKRAFSLALTVFQIL